MSENLTYPQDKVRISATYRAAQVGDVIPAGHPETVQIELNDDVVPGDPGQRIAFLTALIDSLFRDDVAEVTSVTTIEPVPGRAEPAVGGGQR